MRHAFIDIGDKTMCSRCGNEVKRVDEVCPAVTDGKMYGLPSDLTPEDVKALFSMPDDDDACHSSLPQPSNG